MPITRFNSLYKLGLYLDLAFSKRKNVLDLERALGRPWKVAREGGLDGERTPRAQLLRAARPRRRRQLPARRAAPRPAERGAHGNRALPAAALAGRCR